jgi:DNA end-binding protein Ku
MAEIIEAKREEKPLPEAPEPRQPTQVLDLMAALQESGPKVKAARGEGVGPADVHEMPKPKKKAAKKAGAKKTSGRRPRSA